MSHNGAAEHSWQGVHHRDVEVTLMCLLFVGDQLQIVWIYDMIRINYSLLSGLCFLLELQCNRQSSLLCTSKPKPLSSCHTPSGYRRHVFRSKRQESGGLDTRGRHTFLRRGAVTAKISASGSEIDFNSLDRSLDS
jgi:hypothetical protein